MNPIKFEMVTLEEVSVESPKLKSGGMSNLSESSSSPYGPAVFLMQQNSSPTLRKPRKTLIGKRPLPLFAIDEEDSKNTPKKERNSSVNNRRATVNNMEKKQSAPEFGNYL